MKEETYQAYKICRNMIARAEKCCNKDHSGEDAFEWMKKAIKCFDASDNGFAERYEKEKQDAVV